MRIGTAKQLTGDLNFKEETENMKILGIRIGKDEKKTRDIIWDEIVGSMERRVDFLETAIAELKRL